MKELKVTPPEGYIIDEEHSTIFNIVFKKKNELPATWEEFCKQNSNKNKEWYTNLSSEVLKYRADTFERNPLRDRNLLSTKEDAEAHLALIQLHRLRDVYRQEWIPDYTNASEYKYSIVYIENNIQILSRAAIKHFLAFQSREIAEQFLENFKDLINTAKELI